MKKSWHLDRRTFLRGTGITVALPLLQAMLANQSNAATKSGSPKRLICIGTHLGFYGPSFYPKQAGANYKVSPILQPIADYRKDFTVISGLDHPGVKKGHPATVNYLTGTDNPKARKRMSIDQVAANAIGSQTRFASLQLEAKTNNQKGKHLSFGKGGIPLPTTTNPRQVFDRLFGKKQGSAKLKETLSDSQSVLDHVLEDAKDLQKKLGKADQAKLDEYLSAIREVELDIQKAEKMADTPQQHLGGEVNIPKGRLSTNQSTQFMYQLIALAFQADLTRVVTFRIPGEAHALSHHGKKKGKVDGFVAIQKKYIADFAKLLKQLKAADDQTGNLLDNTLVMMGSGMGDASIHSTRNLPILVAGGGLKHGKHLQFYGKQKRPLSDLYVTMLQQMGLKTGKFATSRGDFNGILT